MSYILYEGPSMIDGKPIVAVMTGVTNPSRNVKTGAMAQVYFLRSDIPPTDAVKTQEDQSICGNCPHRGSTCYVNVGYGPGAVYQAYKAGSFHPVNPTKAGYNRVIRLGAYGDPCSVPTDILTRLLSHAQAWTGYTHSPLLRPELKSYMQASADTAEEAVLYQNLGWKTFRVKLPEDPLLSGEIMCPNTRTGIQCAQCQLCDGKQMNIAINVHGILPKTTKYRAWRLAKAMVNVGLDIGETASRC